MKSGYKRIGNYIRLVDERNRDLKVTTLLGLSIEKVFIASVANIIGSDMANYKIIRKGQFACSLMQVRRDKKIPVALLHDFDEAIISQAYPVFEIIDRNELDPEYLMMWMSRLEFDRHACFLAVGGVRGSLEWEDFCDMELPVPSIEKQREIVREYNAIVNRIQLNEKMNQKLEETAQAIYKHWFVDFEFPISAEYAASIGKPELEGKPYKSSGGEMVSCPELDQEIPKGWSLSKISEFCRDMKNGATPKRDDPEYWDSPDIPWLKTGEISNNVIWHAEEYISHLGYKKSSTQLLPKDTVLMAMYGATAAQIAYLKFEATTNQACCAMMCKRPEDAAYLYYRLLNNQEEIKSFSIGGAQENLSKALIEKLPIYIGDDNFPDYAALSVLLENKAQNSKKILNLKHLANLLLSGLASAEYKEELAA